MRKRLFTLLIFLAGLACGITATYFLTNEKKSNGLTLHKNEKQISLDFLSNSNSKKIQFFYGYYIESTNDSITIYRND